MPDKFENEELTLSIHQMFSVHTTAKKIWKTQQASIIYFYVEFEFEFEEKITRISDIVTTSVSKISVFKIFFIHTNAKPEF